MDDLSDLTLTAARRGLADGSIDPADLVLDCLAQIEETESAVKAWITVDGEGALAQAAALRRTEPEGPLWGIPFGIKDIIDVAGLPTTAASKILAGNIATDDAPVVGALRRAGAIILGKTNTHEFAYGCVTPPTANPWDLTRIPGGSSGGSAAALAARQCPAALGTDTAGSIRIPASLCGICGLKPKAELIPTKGVITLAQSFDAVGPMARTVEDLTHIWDALVGSDLQTEWKRLSSGAVLDEGFKLALPYEGMLEHLDPEVERAFSEATQILAKLASSTVETDASIPAPHEFDVPRSFILMREALEYHQSRGWWPDRADDYSAETRSYLRFKEDWSWPGGYEAVLASCDRLGRRFRKFLARADLLALPTLPRTSPTHEEAQLVEEGSPRRPVVVDLTRLPAVANVARLAALSIPCGFTPEGLPIGLQLIGADEHLLMQAGIAYQRETDWHTRRPPLIRG